MKKDWGKSKAEGLGGGGAHCKSPNGSKRATNYETRNFRENKKFQWRSRGEEYEEFSALLNSKMTYF